MKLVENRGTSRVAASHHCPIGRLGAPVTKAPFRPHARDVAQSKSRPAAICSITVKLQKAQIRALHRRIARLERMLALAGRPVPKPLPPVDEAAKAKRAAECAAAKEAHAKFMAEQAAGQEEAALRQTEWKAADRQRQKEQQRQKHKEWLAKNPGYQADWYAKN